VDAVVGVAIAFNVAWILLGEGTGLLVVDGQRAAEGLR